MMALQMHAKSGATDDREQTVIRPQDDLNVIVARGDNKAFLPPWGRRAAPFLGNSALAGEVYEAEWFLCEETSREAASNRRAGSYREPSRRMEGILDQDPLERVVNMDETRWKLLNTGFLTVADRAVRQLTACLPGIQRCA
jgi:hypothetical protein